MPFVTVSEIKDISEKALRAHGAKEWIAKSVALAIANSESYGNIICGLYYLESYCLQLESGRVNGTIDPQVSIPRPGSILVDAKYGFARQRLSAPCRRLSRPPRQTGQLRFRLHTPTLARHLDILPANSRRQDC